MEEVFRSGDKKDLFFSEEAILKVFLNYLNETPEPAIALGPRNSVRTAVRRAHRDVGRRERKTAGELLRPGRARQRRVLRGLLEVAPQLSRRPRPERRRGSEVVAQHPAVFLKRQDEIKSK
jgi:hypothetical protein